MACFLQPKALTLKVNVFSQMKAKSGAATASNEEGLVPSPGWQWWETRWGLLGGGGGGGEEPCPIISPGSRQYNRYRRRRWGTLALVWAGDLPSGHGPCLPSFSDTSTCVSRELVAIRPFLALFTKKPLPPLLKRKRERENEKDRERRWEGGRKGGTQERRKRGEGEKKDP